MTTLIVIIIFLFLFWSIIRYSNSYNDQVDSLANKLIKKYFNTSERTLVDVVDASNMIDLPFNTNRLRIAFDENTKLPFNNEYFFLVSYKMKDNIPRQMWVRIEFLFKKEIAYDERFRE